MSSELQDLLERERAALLNGEFDDIETIAAQKESLISNLNIGPDNKVLELLRRNLRLIEAARDGLIHARIQMTEIRELGRGFTTYSAAGSRETGPSGSILGRF